LLKEAEKAFKVFEGMATGEPKSATFTKLVSEAFETRNFASPVPLAGIVSDFCPVPRSGNRYDVSIRRSQMYVRRTPIFHCSFHIYQKATRSCYTNGLSRV